jgi:hypothetical protein
MSASGQLKAAGSDGCERVEREWKRGSHSGPRVRRGLLVNDTGEHLQLGTSVV